MLMPIVVAALSMLIVSLPLSKLAMPRFFPAPGRRARELPVDILRFGFFVSPLLQWLVGWIIERSVIW